MPDHPPSPRRPARRHPARRDDATGPHRPGPAARRVTRSRRTGADTAPTARSARSAAPGVPGRAVPPATGTGPAAVAGARFLGRTAAGVPLTVWLLDPPATATVSGLQARLRPALADPATPDPARSTTTTDPATASDATRHATGDSEAPGSRHDLDDLATDDRDQSSNGQRHGADAGVRPEGCAVPGPPGGITATARPDPVAETPVAEIVTNPQDVTGDPTRPPAAVHGSAPGVAPEAARATARCVLVDAGRDPLDASVFSEAAAGLGPRDVLAVMTVSHLDGQRLHDPRPALVAAATAAGLEHRQHIVTITRRHDADSGRRDPGRERGWELGPDLSLFTRPPTNHASNHAADRQQEAHR